MKNNCIIQLFSYSVILLLLGLAGCDDYAQKDIKYSATSNVQSLNMFVGDEYPLKVSPSNLSFTWTSSDENVATVDQNGLVKAVGRGTADIIARAGDLYCKVPVTAVVRIPMVNYTLNMTWMSLAVDGSMTVKILPIPTDANDMGFAVWTSDDPEIASVSYAGTVKCLALGETTVRCVINGIEKSLSVKVSDVLPCNGPHDLKPDPKNPLIVPAVDFDFGGKGKAWLGWDNQKVEGTGKEGDLSLTYRESLGDPDCTVGIESGGSQYFNVGWTDRGRWLLYSIDVEQSGQYLFDIWACVEGSGGSVTGYALEIDGELVTDNIPLNRHAGGGNWQSYRWYHSAPGNASAPILYMTEGRHKVKFLFRSGGYNLSALRFTAR